VPPHFSAFAPLIRAERIVCIRNVVLDRESILARVHDAYDRRKVMSARTIKGSKRQFGQGMSEYIIITALVAVAGIGLFAAFGDVLQNQMAGMSREMAGQSGSQDISDAQASATTAQNRAQQADSLATYNQQTNADGGN
jgi:hypothetical protein